MTRARYQQVSLDETPYYHCICRCVRRAFLCGRDHYSGQDYEHRRQWVYEVMSNHYHVVLRVDRGRAESWTQREVAKEQDTHPFSHWQPCFSMNGFPVDW